MPEFTADFHDKPFVVALCGSMRTDSHTRKALRIAIQAAEEAGARVKLYDPRVNPLPFCDGEGNKGDEAVREFQKLVKEADGLILGTPEYHGTLSGVMKNMLDLLSFDELSNKVVGLVSILGGQANSNALNHMRLSMRWVHAWVIPHQAAVGRAYSAYDEEDELKDPKIRERVARVGTDVVQYCYQLGPRFQQTRAVD